MNPVLYRYRDSESVIYQPKGSMTDRITTTRALLEQALEALEMATDNYDDSAVGLEIDAVRALRAELAQPQADPVAASGEDLEIYREMANNYFKSAPAWHDAPEVAALKAERDAAMKDAERLDYIEESGNFGVTRYRSGPGGPVLIEAEDGKKDISKSASSLRDAIDSVIKEAK